jgi:predicted nucleic acid-binding protein
MSADRIFVDSCVLILASQAKEDEISKRAMQQLDRDATFLSSLIVELETIPRPTANGFKNQVAFLNDFFAAAEKVECSHQVQELAIVEACKGKSLDCVDSLHVACAIKGGATEIVTAEKPESLLPQYKGLPVRTIRV